MKKKIKDKYDQLGPFDTLQQNLEDAIFNAARELQDILDDLSHIFYDVLYANKLPRQYKHATLAEIRDLLEFYFKCYEASLADDYKLLYKLANDSPFLPPTRKDFFDVKVWNLLNKYKILYEKQKKKK